MDYGKYKFEQSKREKESKKNQKVISIKEIRLSLGIDSHDFNTKLNQTLKFLKSGNKVKATIRFRGRERDYTAKGMDVMNQFAEIVSDVAEVEKKPNFEGRSLMMVLAPKTDKK